MSEVPLYRKADGDTLTLLTRLEFSGANSLSFSRLQGYLAHKKAPPPRNLQHGSKEPAERPLGNLC